MRPDLDEAGIRRYLLGLLPEAEAVALEEAYFADPEILERVRGVENDLLDDHASGRLGSGEKAAFETRYLSSAALRERVLAARALHMARSEGRAGVARSVTSRPIPWRAPLAIAAGLLLAVLALWREPSRPRVGSASAPPRSAPPSQTSPQSASPAGMATASPSTAPPGGPALQPVVFALSPVLLRGQGRPLELRVPAGTETVVLELEGDPAFLPPSTSGLQVVVKTVEGGEVWQGEARRVRDSRRPSLFATARVPARSLAAGDYIVTLSARGTADGTLYSYFFRMAR